MTPWRMLGVAVCIACTPAAAPLPRQPQVAAEAEAEAERVVAPSCSEEVRRLRASMRAVHENRQHWAFPAPELPSGGVDLHGFQPSVAVLYEEGYWWSRDQRMEPREVLAKRIANDLQPNHRYGSLVAAAPQTPTSAVAELLAELGKGTGHYVFLTVGVPWPDAPTPASPEILHEYAERLGSRRDWSRKVSGLYRDEFEKLGEQCPEILDAERRDLGWQAYLEQLPDAFADAQAACGCAADSSRLQTLHYLTNMGPHRPQLRVQLYPIEAGAGGLEVAFAPGETWGETILSFPALPPPPPARLRLVEGPAG